MGSPGITCYLQRDSLAFFGAQAARSNVSHEVIALPRENVALLALAVWENLNLM
jgi:hypothetical protein